MTLATIKPNDYVTCAQAGKALGLSPDSVRRYCNNLKEGKTPALEGIHIGRDWLIPKAEIARYKKERNGKGRPSGSDNKRT